MAEIKKNTDKAAGTPKKANKTRKTNTPKKVTAIAEKKPAEKKQEESGKAYTVRVKSFLNMRGGAGKEYEIVGRIENGEKVIIQEIDNGYGMIEPRKWVDMTFLK